MKLSNITSVFKSKKFLATAALSMIGSSAFAAGEADAEFKKLYDYANNWTTGYLAKSFALFSFIFGAGVGAFKGTMVPALVGVGFALLFSIGPGMITTMIGATI